jgi:hypothetical protein
MSRWAAPQIPFGLSLSKPCSHRGFVHQPFDGRAFDKLSPCSGRTGIRALYLLEIQQSPKK